MKKNHLLFIFKYFVITILLICGAILGGSFSPAVLAVFYLYLSVRFLTDPAEKDDMRSALIICVVYVLIMTFAVILFFTIIRIALKQLAGLDVYTVRASALYCILIALTLREIGRFSFIEKDWKYFFPGILAAGTVSIAVFLPVWAVADLLAAVLIAGLVFVLCFRKAFAIMRKIVDRL
ncbi:MAG: hypothetical protein JW874_10490 [Spirochaetales bacterium]|nr:hypothetical protein [Spirochaetales bacterium]